MRALGWAASVLGVIAALLALAAVTVWLDRPDLADYAERTVSPAPERFVGVKATFLGVSTILFDDGDTRLLTDGFFSRPGLLDLARGARVAPDTARIEAGLARAGIERLAALVTVHSHYDHALDVAEVARLTGATVVGSASTANIARGAGLDEARIRGVGNGEPLRFGAFSVTLLPSRHAPLGEDGGPPLPGEIEQPLRAPAPLSAYREGGSFSILIEHPRGTALVQGSAGYRPNALDGVRADVVFLAVGGLSRLGEDHAGAYWRHVVVATGARRVVLTHWDDFSGDAYPGTIAAFPRLFDDLGWTFSFLDALARPAGIGLALPPAYQPIALY